ncbi:MAG: hypothetical protein JWO29_1152 [Arthrobacter sp.]|nr:hypothetical protein [Arthrobacter sp.]
MSTPDHASRHFREGQAYPRLDLPKLAWPADHLPVHITHQASAALAGGALGASYAVLLVRSDGAEARPERGPGRGDKDGGLV